MSALQAFGALALFAVGALFVARLHKAPTRRRLWASFGVALVCWLIGAVLATLASSAEAADQVPRDALRYQGTLTREAQRVWGLRAPVATFAAQVHQESRWRADARSPVGAQGLAQFMPSTAQWIGGLQASLGERAPANPVWALRALVVYDQWLSERIRADSPCERMAFALSAYNGGLGWVYKRQRASATPGVCMGATCTINPGIAPAAQRENEQYPRLILTRYEPLYRGWGPGSCSA